MLSLGVAGFVVHSFAPSTSAQSPGKAKKAKKPKKAKKAKKGSETGASAPASNGAGATASTQVGSGKPAQGGGAASNGGSGKPKEAPAATAPGGKRSAGAAATGSTATPRESPVEHFRAGREFYQRGLYREAAVELKRAYDLDPEAPNLVYNLARVYELLPDLRAALTYYEQYYAVLMRKQAKDGGLDEDIVQAKKAIERVNGAMEQAAASEALRRQQQEASAAPPPVDPQDLLGPRFGRADILFWSATSAGVLFALTAAMTGLIALETSSMLDKVVLTTPDDWKTRQTLNARLQTLAWTTDIGFGLAIASAATAVALYFLRPEPKDVSTPPSDRPKPKPAATITWLPGVALAPGVAVLTLRGTL